MACKYSSIDIKCKFLVWPQHTLTLSNIVACKYSSIDIKCKFLVCTTTHTNNRGIIAEFWEVRFGSHGYYVTKKSLAQCSYKKNPEMFNLNLWFVCTRMLNCNCLDLQWLTDSYIPSTVSPSKWGGPDACHQRRLWGGSEGTVPTRAHRRAGEGCKNIGSCHLSPPRFHPRFLATGVIALIT